MEGPWRDLFMFIGLLVLIFVVWVGTGGPERAGSDAERRSVRSKSATVVRGDIRDVARDVEDIAERLKELRIEGIASPYRDVISFSGGNPGEQLAIDEYVRIRASSRLKSPVNITGWRIESLLTGNYGTIPGATPLPFTGVVNSESPILLQGGETAIIGSGRAPLGVSFRENLCTGYLDQVQRFTPRLSKRCPDPDDEFDDFSGSIPESTRDEDYDQCVQYVRRIDRCEIVREDFRERHVRPSPSGVKLPLTDQCSTFIEDNLTYQGCVTNHLSDPDFFRKEWRVFMGSFSELWRKKHEVLRLLDSSGHVVDVWQY